MRPKYDIKWYESVPSTNKVAWEALESLDNLSVIAARTQTEGRGQGCHTWHSAPGENLLFTIVVKWPAQGREAVSQKQISDSVASSIVAYLGSKGIQARIKQPNDIYVGGKKICGILIKHKVSGNFLKATIIGIGLNLNETEFPEYLPNPTSLARELPAKYSPEEELETLLSHIDIDKLS